MKQGGSAVVCVSQCVTAQCVCVAWLVACGGSVDSSCIRNSGVFQDHVVNITLKFTHFVIPKSRD